MPISNPKPDLHNINARTKFRENPLMFTQVIIRKRKPDGRTDRHTDVQRETIISRHYRVAGYNNGKIYSLYSETSLKLSSFLKFISTLQLKNMASVIETRPREPSTRPADHWVKTASVILVRTKSNHYFDMHRVGFSRNHL